MPSYCIKFKAVPKDYTIVNGNLLIFRYYNKQYVVVYYKYNQNMRYRDCGDVANAIGVEINDKRISMVEPKDSLYIYFINIVPKNMPYFKGTTVSIINNVLD